MVTDRSSSRSVAADGFDPENARVCVGTLGGRVVPLLNMVPTDRHELGQDANPAILRDLARLRGRNLRSLRGTREQDEPVGLSESSTPPCRQADMLSSMRFVWAVAVARARHRRVRRRARRGRMEVTGLGGRGGATGGVGQRWRDATTGGGGACGRVPPPPSPTLPNTPGCYTKTDAGWIQQPCNCEMPLDNITHAAVDVRIALTVDPASVTPSLTGAPAMQVTFEDPDGSWFAVWSAQPNAGTAFAVTTAGGSTTVRLGAARVDLAAVPLSACLSRMGMGDVGRTSNVILDMEASFTSGRNRRGHRRRRLPVLHAALTPESIRWHAPGSIATSGSPQLFALARVAGEGKGEGPHYCCGAGPLTRRPNGRRPLPRGEAQS